jgi:hypothetical protein
MAFPVGFRNRHSPNNGLVLVENTEKPNYGREVADSMPPPPIKVH